MSEAQLIEPGLILADNPGPMTLDGTNTWLIAGGQHIGGTILVDPGPTDPQHLAAIDERTGGRVAEIWVTHHHIDHIEAAYPLGEKYGAPVRTFEPERSTGDPLVDGVSLDLAYATLQVHHTPGHSFDSICFVLDSESGTRLFTGDTVLGRGTTIIASPSGNLTDYLKSLEWLRATVTERGIDRILPGHGEIIEDPSAALNALWAHRMQRLDQIREAWANGARTAAEVVEQVYTDLDPKLVWAAQHSARAQLDYLASRGEAEYDPADTARLRAAGVHPESS
ncbi:MBL fold metallo-hydrolase [Granulicoccus phenolivorans]|uniref:MBL fold metallo-hydrolase n=1 Tax=Granulicoccus phenolivorans TaxID=266854 RepID=UPI0004201423|nr:MBL fold metallo-hydrolase [Granulicoccus phenolivorans]